MQFATFCYSALVGAVLVKFAYVFANTNYLPKSLLYYPNKGIYYHIMKKKRCKILSYRFYLCLNRLPREKGWFYWGIDADRRFLTTCIKQSFKWQTFDILAAILKLDYSSYRILKNCCC